MPAVLIVRPMAFKSGGPPRSPRSARWSS